MTFQSVWFEEPVREFAEAHGAALAKAHARDGEVTGLHLTPIKTANGKLVAIAKWPDVERVVKHFDDLDAFRRERDALGAFAGSGLVPNLISATEARRLLVMEKVEGRRMGDLLQEPALDLQCRRLGGWMRQLDRVAPRQRDAGNWYDYLVAHPKLVNSKVIATHREVLSELPFRHRTLARNDGGLTNILAAEDGTIRGVDFDRVRMKPTGWDLFLTAAAIAERFPEQSNTIAERLAEGFWPGNPGQSARFTALAKIFILATVFEPAAPEHAA